MVGHSRQASCASGTTGGSSPRRLEMPPFRPDASQPTMPFSTTTTSRPALVSQYPVDRPVTPLPMTPTSALSMFPQRASRETRSVLDLDPRGEPRGPPLSHRRGLVTGRQDSHRDWPHRRTIGGERDPGDIEAGGVGEE